MRALKYLILLFSVIGAQVSKAENEIQWKAGLFSDLPVALGAETRVTFPFDILTALKLGFVPEPYVKLINHVSEEAGFYDSQTSQVIKSLLPNSFFLNFGVGKDNFIFEGFSIEMGYSLVVGSGGATAKDLLETILGITIPASGSSTTRNVSGEIHSLTLMLGYRWEFYERWHLLSRVGFIKPLASTSRITLPNASASTAQSINAAFDNYMDGIFEDLWVPLLSVAVFYSF